ncbi:MAG: CaiB/BaiF CoA transferase family protein [Dehalococcoidia bacterium]
MTTPAKGALTGVTILDLTRVWAGPLATRILGDLGANVIKIEATWARGPKQVSQSDVTVSGRFPDNLAGERPWNREGMFNKLNRSKKSVTLQLNTTEGKELFERLVPLADVVIENYTPRVMPQLGLGYERLRELNPGIIYVSMPGYGWDGPSRDFAALGTALEPEAGLSSLMGYEDSGPYKSGVAWADPVAAMHGAAAVLMGIIDRDADPERRGQAVELAQIEGMVCFIGGEVLAAQRSPEVQRPRGNRHPVYAPQGCYPCAGEDRWLAISVTSDAEWSALCQAAGFGEELAGLSREERVQRQDALDARIAGWARNHERNRLERELQERGVIAIAVNDARDIVLHEHLAARSFFADIVHPDAGRKLFPGLPFQMSKTPAAYNLPAPGLGEHNREILQGMLGLTDEGLDTLTERGVIAEEPPG